MCFWFNFQCQPVYKSDQEQWSYLEQVDGDPGNVATPKDDDYGDKDGGNPLVPLVSALDAASPAWLGKDMVDVTIEKTKKKKGE